MVSGKGVAPHQLSPAVLSPGTLLNLKWQGGLEPYFGGRWTPHSRCPSKPGTKVPPKHSQPRRERASPVTTSVPWSQTGQGGCLRHRASSWVGFGQPRLKAVLLSQPQAHMDSHFLLHHIPEKESTTALAGVTRSCLAGRGVSYFAFFFSLGTLCNCCEIPPSPNALGHGKWQGQSRLHELGRSRQRNGQRPPSQEGPCQIFPSALCCSPQG